MLVSNEFDHFHAMGTTRFGSDPKPEDHVFVSSILGSPERVLCHSLTQILLCPWHGSGRTHWKPRIWTICSALFIKGSAIAFLHPDFYERSRIHTFLHLAMLEVEDGPKSLEQWLLCRWNILTAAIVHYLSELLQVRTGSGLPNCFAIIGTDRTKPEPVRCRIAGWFHLD